MPLTIQDILDRSGALILETQENSITPPRVGELTYALAELILQGSLGGNVIGASKLKELEDVMLLGEQDNDILQLMGGKWKNTNLDLTKLQAMAGYFELDDDDNLFTNYNLYSTKEIAAFGAGSDGSGTNFSRLDAWSMYTNDKSGWVLSALLGKELHDRVLVLEAGGGGGGIGTEIDPTVAAHIKNITTGDLTNWSAAYAKSHEHANISILNATTASFLAEDRDKLDGIAAGAQVNVQTNWDAVSGPAAILNKPHALPASDVYAWAKTPTKPSYTASEIEGLGASYRWLTDAYISTWNAKEPAITKGTTAQYFRGDMSLALFPTALPASDVYAWAKTATKPSYTASEIGGLGTNYRWLTDAYIATWNAKANGTHTHSFSEIGITGLSANYLTKYNGSTLVNSLIFDNDTNVGIGTASPNTSYKLDINGGLRANSIYSPTIIAGNSATGRRIELFDNNEARIKMWHSASTEGFVATTNSSGLTDLILKNATGKSFVNFRADASMNYFKATHPITGAEAISFANTETLSYIHMPTANGRIVIGSNGAYLPEHRLVVLGSAYFQTDIKTDFINWTHATNKNSLDKFLKLFDIDTAGNLVVKTNLYGTGEIAALGAGTGVSELTLMADMNANGKNINNLTSISKSGSKINLSDPTFMVFSIWDSDRFVISDDGIYAMTKIEASSFYTSGAVNATEFKFGNWTFKQDVSGRLGIYNGTTEVACFNADGTYVNL